MPLLEVAGNADKLPPEQMAATGVKVGVTIGLTVIVSVTGNAHKLAVGVNV